MGSNNPKYNVSPPEILPIYSFKEVLLLENARRLREATIRKYSAEIDKLGTSPNTSDIRTIQLKCQDELKELTETIAHMEGCRGGGYTVMIKGED